MQYLICATHRETGEIAWLYRAYRHCEYSFVKTGARVRYGKANKGEANKLYTRDEATRLTGEDACALLELLEDRFRHIDNDEADNAPWITDWRIVPARD